MIAKVMKPPVLAALFTFVGLAVRLYGLDERQFSFDELVFASSVRLNSPADVLFLTSQYGDQSPLSFFLPWLVRGLGGSEWVVRLPFALAGSLCVPAIYLFGREIARPRVGLVAALLFALSPFAVFYSQDVHPYAPLLLFTTFQLYFAYRAAVRGLWFDWAAFSLFSILNLYNDYIAFIVAAVVALFLALALVGRVVAVVRAHAMRAGAYPISISVRWVGIQFAFAFASLVTISLAYLPWLPSVQHFFNSSFLLDSPFVHINKLQDYQYGPFTELQILANRLGFDSLPLAFLFIGAIYMVVTLVRERRLSSLLLFIWLGLPLTGFWLRAGDTMLLLRINYYSFLVPAAILLVAMGMESAAQFAKWLSSRLLNRRTSQGSGATFRIEQGSRTVKGAMRVFYSVLLFLSLAQTSVALVGSYSAPKTVPQDYGVAVDRIIADSPPGSMVLSIGMWGIKPSPGDFLNGVDYYLWLRRSPIKMLDASQLDIYTVTNITNKDAIMWGVVLLPRPLTSEEAQHATDLELEIIPLENITLLRQRTPRGAPAQQIDILLNWGREMQPGLVATRAMLNPDFRSATLGDNILPPIEDIQIPSHRNNLLNGEQQQDKWVLWSGDSLAPDARSFVISSDGSQPDVNLTLSTRRLASNQVYVLTFHYRNTNLRGEQRVYLSTYTDDGSLVDTFPYGAGFLCPPNSDSESAFALYVPSIATNAILWLRIAGIGTADFSSIELQPVR